jgi:hypothetical protein
MRYFLKGISYSGAYQQHKYSYNLKINISDDGDNSLLIVLK